MFVSEVFKTVQGEGNYCGFPSIFFRVSGCNLRCQFQNEDGVTNLCDAFFTSWEPEGIEMSVNDAASQIIDLATELIDHVVITGGEPFIFEKELEQLCAILKEHNKFITIETNATRFHYVKADFISMSPKLSSSTPIVGTWSEKHEKRRINKEVIHSFLGSYACQIKFVVARSSDLDEILQLKEELSLPRNKIVLMAEGISSEEIRAKQNWILEICKKYGFRYSDRLHIHAWNNKRGT